jgi:hypothetical protein
MEWIISLKYLLRWKHPSLFVRFGYVEMRMFLMIKIYLPCRLSNGELGCFVHARDIFMKMSMWLEDNLRGISQHRWQSNMQIGPPCITIGVFTPSLMMACIRSFFCFFACETFFTLSGSVHLSYKETVYND